MQRHSELLCSVGLYEIDDVMRLQDLDQKDGNNVTRVSKEALVIFLGLEYVYQISALCRNACDVKNFVLPLFLVVWRVWNLEVLLVSGVVNLHKPKLWKAVFKTNRV